MAISCKYCRHFDPTEKKGYKGYCTYYGNYEDPDNVAVNCSRFDSAGGSSSCYLTSACIAAKGLPDNCRELTVLRKFRDTYLCNTSEGKSDISHYYESAPKIVRAINAREDSQSIWEKVYDELVIPSVQLILDGRNADAHHLYRSYSLVLEKQYQ